MKRLFILMLIGLLSLPAYAAEKGETYLGPVLGYHFFDNDHDLDDKVEGGFRLGHFLTEAYLSKARSTTPTPTTTQKVTQVQHHSRLSA